MRPEDALTPSERELASALAGLKPGTKGINRNRLMFEAGRRSMRRNALAWRAVSLLLCIGFGLSWVNRPVPQTSERIIYVSSPSGQPVIAVSSPGRIGESYFQIQERVLREGLDALSADRTPSAREVPKEMTIEELVGDLSHGI